MKPVNLLIQEVHSSHSRVHVKKQQTKKNYTKAQHNHIAENQ